MNTEEIRNLSVDKIQDELDQAREELMRMRFQQATGELTNHNLPKGTRRKIARLLTILNEKSLSEESAQGEA
ncbi:MAG: 50S ribosomal protein L29 [Chloroflexi bacterium]|nr:50S ribosomal protein L29 [Chloroflexota bacterium]